MILVVVLIQLFVHVANEILLRRYSWVSVPTFNFGAHDCVKGLVVQIVISLCCIEIFIPIVYAQSL